MDLKVTVILFFFSVYVAFAANQVGYSPSSAIHAHADAIDYIVGIRKKRGLLKASPKLITGARFLWRVRQAKKVLLKDAVLVDTIFSTDKVYKKAGGVKRAKQDFLDMHLHNDKYSTSEKIIAAQMGKYKVLYKESDPKCKAPCPVIDMWKPSFPGARKERIVIVYSDTLKSVPSSVWFKSRRAP